GFFISGINKNIQIHPMAFLLPNHSKIRQKKPTPAIPGAGRQNIPGFMECSDRRLFIKLK
ncbi:hypothetical protein OM328_10610, partial [Escherichia albertii]|nr:hypothetical protein [Escherichia albertii]MCZ8559547.1 hypothetical protein [Escherichia albertii]MCZ8563778.1 hypothetical protein [Escherichia albertii]MCZ8568071.1 hypothetical protein [Escherichia albertii]MCZ8576903.1 hypothetical protein [Escherichia albertii]